MPAHSDTFFAVTHSPGYFELFTTVRFGVQPVGIPVVGEGRKGGRDKISQNSRLCEHL
jgi:hypothetical protein